MATPDEAPGDGTAAVADVSDTPYLSIERLMEQLVERASDIITAQQRVRTLLAANRSIVGELSLPVVLRRIVEAAREVAGARYAALGVIGADGLLEQFVHTGMEAAAVAAIGQLPRGRGVLGAVIAHPDPIRLRRISDDPRSSGFPDGHPPMTSFLGVPIRAHDVVFGNLYLTDRADGLDFTDEDVELVEALAATAGIAIENARLYEESGRRQQWLRASSDVSRDLLSTTGREVDVLQHIANHVRQLADADVVLLVLPSEDFPDELEVAVATGLRALELVGLHFPSAHSIAAQVMAEGRAIMLDTVDQHPGYLQLAGSFPAGPAMALPLTGGWSRRGAIVVGRLPSRVTFAQADLDMAGAFAGHAALALELEEARADQQRLTELEDRERIGRDLHDHVIQRLFASGLSAQSLAEKSTEPFIRDGLNHTVAELTETIRQIRSTIQALRDPTSMAPSVRQMVGSVVEQISPLLGFRPQTHLSGPLDTLVDDVMVADLEAVVRESLTNVVKHARARSAAVTVEVNSSRLVVTVRDDGVGLRAAERRSGLANIRRRAEDRGGRLVLDDDPEGGLRLQWTIPMSI